MQAKYKIYIFAAEKTITMLLFAWENLTFMGKLYWILAIPSTAVFVILLILSFFGADADAEIDADVDVGGDFSGFIINLKSIMSFAMMFGWAGIISMNYNLTTVITLIVALITGLVGLIAVSFLLFFVSKMSYSGNMQKENAIGKVGTVVLRIPPKRQGMGQIQINIQGGLRTLEAMTEENELLKSGTKVLVIDIQDNVLIVMNEI